MGCRRVADDIEAIGNKQSDDPMSSESHRETELGKPRMAVRPRRAARSVLIAVNPRAGARARHSQVREIEQVLAAAAYEVRSTTELGQLSEWALAATEEHGGLRAVVSVGGDGTASLVRSHIPAGVPLLPLPLGTENLLAQYIDQQAAPPAVRQTLDEGITIELDMGKAGERLFLLMISAGFDAEVIRRLHEGRQGNITRVSYLLPTLRTMCDYGYPEMQLYWGDSAEAGTALVRCRWMFGFNLPLYALRLPIAPDAVATDGLLDVCTFEGGRGHNVARYLLHVMLRNHVALSDTTMTRGRRLRLESANAVDVAYQLDGDFAGTLPVDVEVLPGQLRLLVSQATARRLGFALPDDDSTMAPLAGTPIR
jgi:diacylglycerol kinase family enzyme